MNTFYPQTNTAMITDEAEALLAQRTSIRLATLLGKEHEYGLQVITRGEAKEVYRLPISALPLLIQMLSEMAQGYDVAVMPTQIELSVQQAADLLTISRAYLLQLLEDGTIPFRKTGRQRRITLQDVLAYKRDLYNQRLQILNELTAYDQELGLQ